MLSHKNFLQPEDGNTKVWRYINLIKFLDFYFSQSLYLCRIDLLEDKHEGTYTRKNSKRFPFVEVQLPSGIKLTQEQYTLRMRNSLYVNCWRMDVYESEAMWKLYCPSNEGIAIQTTYNKLAKSLPEDIKIYMGKVQYLDYENDTFDPWNHFNFIMHKRRSFEHEKEIRIATSLQNYMNDHTAPEAEPGMLIKTDLINNIETIYVNPYANEWYFNTVQTLFIKLNINIPLKWSEIKSEVYY